MIGAYEEITWIARGCAAAYTALPNSVLMPLQCERRCP